MRKLKKFIAYFVVFFMSFTLGMYSEKLKNTFYPNASNNLNEKSIHNINESTPAIQSEEIITADTKLITIENNLATKTQVYNESYIPVKYIGLTREQFLEEMEVYEYSPALSDVKKGFHSLMVVSFSRQKIELQKNYLPKGEEKQHYYIISKDNKLVVYLEDMETVYLSTDISMDSLPEKVKLEILQKKYFESEEELYNFLESYSS